MSIQIINPANEELVREYNEDTTAQIQEKIDATYHTFESWKNSDFNKRTELIRNTASILRDNKEQYAKLITEEMGKPFAQSIGEIEKCAWLCDYYAGHGPEFLDDKQINTEFSKSYASFQPLGVVLAVMPWNFPFWQVFRFAIPAIMAGNAGLLKHSRNTMGCALEIEKIFLDAGFPDHLFTNLVISSKHVNDIIANNKVAAVTLTGSTPVGSKVAAQAGSYLKKTVMELGGSDPYIVLQDADLEKTVEACVTARMINSGQSCIAGKRFIVERPIIERFTEMFQEKMEKYKFGDPTIEDINLGPMAREDLRNELHRQVKRSIDGGAEAVIGGEIPEDKGYFYPPTILINVHPGSPAYDEELFGPVASIITAENEEHAIRIANDTEFGLGAAIFSQNIDNAEYIAKNKIDAGCCFVNDFVKSDPRLPFGGIKNSGYGRELSEFGIREFVNIKSVVVK